MVFFYLFFCMSYNLFGLMQSTESVDHQLLEILQKDDVEKFKNFYVNGSKISGDYIFSAPFEGERLLSIALKLRSNDIARYLTPQQTIKNINKIQESPNSKRNALNIVKDINPKAEVSERASLDLTQDASKFEQIVKKSKANSFRRLLNRLRK